MAQQYFDDLPMKYDRVPQLCYINYRRVDDNHIILINIIYTYNIYNIACIVLILVILILYYLVISIIDTVYQAGGF